MTKQETFDIIVNHLRKQRCKSAENSKCLYRGPNNTKCAAGILIPDKDYIPQMEYANINDGHNIGLVFDMQHVHDNCHINNWEEHFRFFANLHRLKYECN